MTKFYKDLYFYEIPDEHQIEKIVATLTPKEAVVYKALILSCMINRNEKGSAVIELQTCLESALKVARESIELSSRSFSGLVGSLAKKQLYQLMEWFGADHNHYKTVIINGQKEKVHPYFAYVFCTREFYKSVFMGKYDSLSEEI